MNIWRLPLLDAGRAGAAEKLIQSTRDDVAPQHSPDGSKIVFTSNRSGQHEVFVSAGDGSNPVQLTSLRAGMTGSPHWSPDGKQIVFDSNVEGQFEVYRVNPAGGTPRRLTTHAADDALASYSRDGRFIYFSSNRTGSWQIYRMPAEGGDPVQITQQGGRAALESLDGQFLYYEQGQPLNLWRRRAGGGEETQVATGVAFLNHALTDKGVYFISRPDAESAATLRSLPYTATTSRPLLEIANPVAAGLAASPDGKSLLFVSVDQRGS